MGNWQCVGEFKVKAPSDLTMEDDSQVSQRIDLTVPEKSIVNSPFWINNSKPILSQKFFILT